MNRRRFLGSVLAVAAAPFVPAPFVEVMETFDPMGGTFFYPMGGTFAARVLPPLADRIAFLEPDCYPLSAFCCQVKAEPPEYARWTEGI